MHDGKSKCYMIYVRLFFCQISKMVKEISWFSCSVRDTPASKSGEDLDWITYHEDVGMVGFNTLRPRQNGRHFADDIFKCIFLNENVWISIKISLKFVPKGPINDIPTLVQIMALRRPGDKPLSEPMMGSSLTHICVTRPQWVNTCAVKFDRFC